VIPAYQADQTLIRVVNGLLERIPDRQIPKVIVVNDGSTLQASANVFDELRAMHSVSVLVHETNLGKGAALKTAFAYVLDHLAQVSIVVTADADGQHLVEDIIAVAEKAVIENKFVLGVRRIDASVPARSRFGNVLTPFLFRALLLADIVDTQTGLRAIQRHNLPELLAIPFNRYNFEFEALIRLVKRGEIAQVPIQTVYEPGNPSSHFNPLLDSARVYAVFARHLSMVTLIGLVDWILFTTFSAAGLSVLSSLVIGRAISTIGYFILARKYVFRSNGNAVVQAALFLLLVVGNVALLWPFITMAHDGLGIPKPLAMLAGYLFLFVSNFLWQNHIVFQRSESDA